jgi:hypothetical protein
MMQTVNTRNVEILLKMEIDAERKKRKKKGAVPLSPTSSIFKVCFAFLPSAILAD